jgi:hypothetical protein
MKRFIHGVPTVNRAFSTTNIAETASPASGPKIDREKMNIASSSRCRAERLYLYARSICKMAQEESRRCSPQVGTPLSRMGENTVCEEDRRRHGLFLTFLDDSKRKRTPWRKAADREFSAGPGRV